MSTMADSFMGFGELNSSLGVCKACTLPTEPFLRPLFRASCEVEGDWDGGEDAVGPQLHSALHVRTEVWPARASLKGGPE